MSSVALMCYKLTSRTLGALVALLSFSVSCDSSTKPDPDPGSQVSLSLSTISASQSSIVANGTTSSQITVALRDAQGAAVGKSAGTVTMSATRGTLSAVSDQSNGTYTATLTSSTSAGPAVVSASIAGGSLTNTATVNFVAGPAAAITVANASSNGQSAVVGATVANPPSVKVTDANNNPVAGVSVTFAVASGGGSITGANQTTNDQGVATVGSWRLGNSVGANTLTATVAAASVAGFAGTSAMADLIVTFTATGIAGVPASIAIANPASNNQTAPAGAAVAIPPSVKVVDVSGNAIPGVPVTFAVASGGGSITGANATTDASGVAQIGSWTLGAAAGPNSLTATSGSLAGSPVTFTATGTSGAAGNITIVSGDGQTAIAGSTVAAPPSVKVTDANGNIVAGASVTFSVATGGGSVTGGTATTNASGVATVGSWRLGTIAGPNTLTASSGALPPVTFTATGTAGAAALITISTGNNQFATAGTIVAIPPAVKVTDANGNAVAGTGVTFAVTAGGGSATGASATTNATGIATVGSWTLGAAGPNSLSATINGVAGQSVTFNATATALAGLVVNVTGKLERSETVTLSVTQDGTALTPAQYTVSLVPADGGTDNTDGTIKLLKTGALAINVQAGTRNGSANISVAQPPLVVFDLVRNFSRQIWQVAIDGGDLVQLTTNGSDNQHPSRVGTKLIYAGARNGKPFDIFALNLATSSETQITNNNFAERDPNLSPNGNRIVYVSSESGLDRAVYSNADGTGAGFVDDISNNTGAIEISPAWSPASDKVVLSSTAQGGSPDLWIQNSLGGLAAKMPAPPVNTSSAEVNPVWNSNGRIAFHTTRSAGANEIWITDVSGATATKLTDGVEPTWLPDGRLVFTRLTSSPSGPIGSLFWIDITNPSVVHPIVIDGGGDARRPSGVLP